MIFFRDTLLKTGTPGKSGTDGHLIRTLLHGPGQSHKLMSLAKQTVTCQKAEGRVHSISNPAVPAAGCRAKDEWNAFHK